ncbi:MAG: hemerythrin domain-containing protein, partial [Nocardioidaceae bacterium]
AALKEGRDPRQIRRLLNIADDDTTAESLAELCLRYGVSALILGSDDESRIRRFGEEIAPEVRRIVGEERSGTTSPSPDDGRPLSEAMPWDESARPTAGVEDAAAVYPANGRAVAQHLVDVHDSLRAELEQLRDLVEQVRNGLAPGTARSLLNELTLKQNNWTLGAYCQSYCRVVTGHHSLEDHQIFPHLRATADGLAPVIDRLQEEHVVIHGVIDAVDRALVGLAANDRDLTPLERAVDLLTDTLLSHLAYEERELADPLARHGFYEGQL